MNTKKRIIILSLVFLIAVVLSMVGRKEAGAIHSRGSAFQAASLPVMCFSWENSLINPLYGQSALQERGAQDPSVYPFMSEDLQMEVYLVDGRERPAQVSYALRDEADGRLVAQGTVDQFSDHQSMISFPIAFDDILQADHYYLLDFTLSLSRQTVSYHTRVLKVSDKDTVTMLTEYARHMHEDLFRRESARAYVSHLETDSYSDKDTLSTVSLNSSFDQLCWGDSGARRVGDSWMTIEAIQGNYLYLHFSYLAEAPMNSEINASFRVSESISLQRYGMAIYLMNYERHVGQLWSFENNSVVAEGFLLGIQESDQLSAMSSENGRYSCFSVGGDLYLYQEDEALLTKLFSFRQSGEHPLRTLQHSYDVKIMEVRDDGQVEFAVCGYMNGGPREGLTGISYCRYEAESDQLQEQMFLHSKQAPATLLQEARRLLTKGNDDFLYFILDEELLVMDIGTGETAVLVSRTEYPGLMVSASGSVFAWSSETDQACPQTLRMINLKNGKRETMGLEREEAFLRPLGFLREDLVVGYATSEEILVQDGLAEHRPYERIVILDEDLQTLYEYHQEGGWIDRVDVLEDKMILHRYGLEEGSYKYLSADVMLRSQQAASSGQAYSYYNHENLKKLSVLRYDKLPSSLRIEQKAIRLFSAGKQLDSPPAEPDGVYSHRYYAYGKDGLMGAYTHLGSAIRKAGEAYGYVLSREGRTVWKWVGRMESCILEVDERLLNPGPDWEEVSGASLRELMCFLHEGTAVRWVSPDQGDLWLLGYEWNNVVLYNGANARVFRMLQSDFEEFIGRDNNYLWINVPQ